MLRERVGSRRIGQVEQERLISTDSLGFRLWLPSLFAGPELAHHLDKPGVLLGNGEQRRASLTAAFNARFAILVGLVEAVTGAFALPLNGPDFQHPES